MLSADREKRDREKKYRGTENSETLKRDIMNRTVPKKKSYETPYTKKTQVELEESLCVTGSIDPTTKSPGMSTTSQKVNSDFNTDNDFTNDSWD